LDLAIVALLVTLQSVAQVAAIRNGLIAKPADRGGLVDAPMKLLG
jgi:hypothetical protein